MAEAVAIVASVFVGCCLVAAVIAALFRGL